MNHGDVALTIMDDLRACLDTNLAEHGAGRACFVGLYPGHEAVADWCQCNGGRGADTTRCGMGWVRLERIYPYRGQLGQVDTTTTSCDSPLAAVIEVGTLRCIHTVKGDGTPPDAAALANDTMAQLADLSAMHRTLTCCAALTSRDTILGGYQVIPTSGGCGGAKWTVTVQLIRR